MGPDRLERAARAGAMLHPAPPAADLAALPRAAARLPAPDLLPAAEPAPAPALVPASQPAPKRPAHRRAGRRALRLLRPLALPLLHRLDWRIRGAVDRTETSAAVARVEAALAAVAARLDALEAARSGDRAELLRAVAAARVPDEALAGLALRLDAARLQVRDAGAAAGAVSAEAVALLRSLHPKADDLGLQARALHAKADQAGLDRANLLARTDTLVRRNLVPAGPDVAVRTDDGYLIVPGEDESHVVAMVETAGRLEPGTLDVACALAAEGGLAVDVGAHVGTFTVPLARRVGPGGLVVAVEPTPRTAGALRRTLALNALQDRVALHECAAGRGEGRARLHVAALGSHNSLLPLGDEGVGEVEVAVRALDAIVPAGRPACVVKVDAEGTELEVLGGAGRVLAESPRAGVIAEFGPSHLARAGVSVADWLGAFRAHGFVAWEIGEGSGRLRPLREAGLGAVFSLSLLWLRGTPESYPGLRRA